MHASETRLRQLIEGTKQYVIPLFQRPYSWNEKQWKALWADVIEQSKSDEQRPHFFGSIVTTPAKSVPQGVGKWLMIDGQQRITTIQVLLAAIRDNAKRLLETRLSERIDGQFLINPYEDGDERLKVLPTQDDRPAFRAIIKGETIPEGRLKSCYEFFDNRLSRYESKDLEALQTAIADRLVLVGITCEENDNPHLIFESLNAKGEKLTPADLIRNYLLMRVHVTDQTRLFQNYWLPIQQALGSDLTEFVRHYLMKEGKILKESDIYFELKDRLKNAPPSEAESFLKDLHRNGLIYAKFLHPSRESDSEISDQLTRLQRLKFTVANPLLLRIFEAFESGSLNRSQLIESLEILESFLVRRSVCGLPTNQLRRMLPPVFDATGGAGPEFIEGLRRKLGGSRCPDDGKFIDSLVNSPLYSSAEKNARLRLILERIEQSFGHKEHAALEKAQIEHILPQTISTDWKADLSKYEEEEYIHMIHTLGNLTLTKYNSDMSNRRFSEKKQVYSNSHYELNRSVAEQVAWTPESILARGHFLANRCVNIWKRIDDGNDIQKSTEIQKMPPSSVRYKSNSVAVKTWREGFVKLLSMFEADKPGTLRKIADEHAIGSVISNDENRFERAKVFIGNTYVNTHASAAQLREWCKRISNLAGIQSEDYDFGNTETSIKSK